MNHLGVQYAFLFAESQGPTVPRCVSSLHLTWPRARARREGKKESWDPGDLGTSGVPKESWNTTMRPRHDKEDDPCVRSKLVTLMT